MSPITNNDNVNTTATKGKRGRKSKKELIASLNGELTNNNLNIIINDNPVKTIDTQQSTIIKKRGRKPKGGKIVQPSSIIETYKEEKPNVILHLKCFLKDIKELHSEFSKIDNFNFNNTEYGFDLYGNSNEINISNYNTTTSINDLDNINSDEDDYDDNNKDKLKELWNKLRQLGHNLHTNNINNKKSCCFWDTCEFDSPPVYIIKHFINGSYQAEGCYCSPECAVAHLFSNKNIDTSTKFERYHLMNNIYGKIYNYSKNIVPAPDPRYMLHKFVGNLTIQEYRSLLGNERLFLIIDKPLTRILPELHEYNDEFILNNKLIPTNNYNIKTRLQRKKQDKNTILNEKFGITSGQ